MSIVQLSDVQAELPTITINSTTKPSDTQVTLFISEIEAEVRATVESGGVPWPADGTSQAAYLKRTILEGVRWMTMRAKWASSAPNSQSPDIDRAYKAYDDRIDKVIAIARSAQNVTDTQAGQPDYIRVPQPVNDSLMPVLTGSFGEYTQARDLTDQWRTARRWTGNRPWPLL